MDVDAVRGATPFSVCGLSNSVRCRVAMAGVVGFLVFLLAQTPSWAGRSLSGQEAMEQDWPSELLRQAERDARTACEAELPCAGTCALGDEKELGALLSQWEKLRSLPRIEITRLPPGLLKIKQKQNQKDTPSPQNPAGWSKNITWSEDAGSNSCHGQGALCNPQAGTRGSSDVQFALKSGK